MKKNGFIVGWQNGHWIGAYNAYNAGQNDPNITAGGNGALPDFMTMNIYGRGYDYYYDEDEERVKYESEISYISPAFKTAGGDTFRFAAMYSRESHDAKTFREVFLLVDCSASGHFAEVSGIGDNAWNSVIGDSGKTYNAYVINSRTLSTSLTWDQLGNRSPFMNNSVFNMMVSNASETYDAVKTATITGTESAELFALRGINKDIIQDTPLEWTDPSKDTTANEIVQRARSLSSYKYWYGGAGQVASKAIADSLKASYPSIWTSGYYNEALNDIGQRIGDCSYLVNYAYGIASPGNHGPGTSQYLSRWSKWIGTPKNGMIVWRNGHTGIYTDGKTLEMKGIKLDYKESEYSAKDWTAILYDPNRQY